MITLVIIILLVIITSLLTIMSASFYEEVFEIDNKTICILLGLFTGPLILLLAIFLIPIIEIRKFLYR